MVLKSPECVRAHDKELNDAKTAVSLSLIRTLLPYEDPARTLQMQIEFELQKANPEKG